VVDIPSSPAGRLESERIDRNGKHVLHRDARCMLVCVSRTMVFPSPMKMINILEPLQPSDFVVMPQRNPIGFPRSPT
jgi:hypothetical protein